MKHDQPISVFWFRRDLRLQDNHGLYNALNSGTPILPIFIFDKEILEKLPTKQDARVCFIHETLMGLNADLKKFNSSIYAIHDTPINAFKKICTAYQIKDVYTNHDYEPDAIQRDKHIGAFLHSKGIGFHTFKDQVIFERNEIQKSDGTPYAVFTPYSNAWKKKYTEQPPIIYQSENHLHNCVKEIFPFPSLLELGFQKVNIELPVPTINRATIQSYHLNRNFPSVKGTTKLSVHLRFGTVSVRALCKIASELNEQWLNELIWREFFMMILYHYPHVAKGSFRPAYDHIPWRNNEHEFEKWCKGETGYLIVDAGMRELNTTGFMHNRVRMIVASFLTKHLLIDWRWGEHYFAEKLLDFELSANNGNWQWAAGCGCDAAPYFRIFNPYEQIKRFDPELIYTKQWIGDLNNYLIPPIVDHKMARERAITTYKKGLLSSR